MIDEQTQELLKSQMDKVTNERRNLKIDFTPYPMSEDDQQRLDRNFTQHDASDEISGQPQRLEEIRFQAQSYATTIYKRCPPSRERSLALTKIEEAAMWAIAAIERE